jgi:RNA methyltransferase, TrmH family
MKTITSLQNPLIKRIVQLGAKARERRREGLFLAEGLREAGLAIRAGYRPLQLFFDPAHTPPEQVAQWSANVGELVAVHSSVFEKIAYRSGVPNVVALFEIPAQQPEALQLPANPLVLVLEAIEKPGNLGAILRTADAAGVDAVLVCDPAADLYNPNTIRASLGALFTLPVYVMEAQEALSWLRARHITIFATHLEASRPVYACDLKGPTALVMGAEATGISPFWVEHADHRVIIPMRGNVDSLNVSASTAILLFEAVRQRNFL